MIKPVSIFQKFTPIKDAEKIALKKCEQKNFLRFDFPIKFDKFIKSAEKEKSNIPEIFY